MKVFTYLVLQVLSSFTFLLNAVWAAFKPLYARAFMAAIGIVYPVTSSKILSDAVVDMSIKELMQK